jgi:hypothetical protein
MNPDDQLAYDNYIHLIQQLDELVVHLEQHPMPETREQVTALLSGLDMLHREGLKRMVDCLHAAGAEAALQQAAEDPVVEIMLGLYDLVELDLPPEPPSTSIPQGNVTLHRQQPASPPGSVPIHLEWNDDR